MFGASFFGKTFFGGTYFGTNIKVTVVVKPRNLPSSSGGSEYTQNTIEISKKKFEKDRQKIIDQLLREDEELINIIIELVIVGIM